MGRKASTTTPHDREPAGSLAAFACPNPECPLFNRFDAGNLSVVERICDLLDSRAPLPSTKARRDLIRFVADRPGHDRRYAIDPSKIERELGWRAVENFETGLEKTVDWYLANEWWWRPIREKKYAGERLGRTA